MAAGETSDVTKGPDESDSVELRRVWNEVDGSPPALSVRIGNYELKREIASGGMGVVYEAVQQDPRRVVALKVMRGGTRSSSWLRRFKYESQLLARLRHPHIAQIYEAGTHGSGAAAVPFFAMEYVPGARNIIEFARSNHLSIKQRLEMFISVCDAVQHAHQKGIIHRDLKPANLLVDSDGQVKVIDFGVARAADSDLASAGAQTDIRSLIGTLQYMSPEQCEGDPNALDARSDVYSLGVVLYELLCLRTPYTFNKPGITEAARVICHEVPPPPGSIDSNLRGDLETVMLKALNKDRSRRYASARDLANDLRHVLGREPIAARRDSLFYVLSKRSAAFMARHRIASALLVVIGTFLMTELLLRPFLLAWTPLGGLAGEWLIRSAAAPAAGTGLYDLVRVVGITDQTNLRDLADREGLEGVPLTTPGVLRHLDGRAMMRLAQARPRAVVWDLAFENQSNFDGEFVKGVTAIKATGADVVVGVRWGWGEGGSPRLSPLIAPHVRVGGISANLQRQEAWRLHLLVQQRDKAQALPSLVLSAIAAFRHPGLDIAIRLSPVAKRVEVDYFKADSTGLVRVDSGSIFLSFAAPETEDPPEGLERGDLIGHLILRMPSDREIESFTVQFEALFNESADQLRARFEGKLVFLADIRSNQPDRFPTPDGRILAGVYAHAAGADAILRGAIIQAGSAVMYSGTLMIVVCAAVLLALAAGASRLKRWTFFAVAVVSPVILSFLAFRLLNFYLNPLLAASAAALGFGLMMAMERSRLRSVG